MSIGIVRALPVEPSLGAGGYVRPTWRQAIAEHLPQPWRSELADRWIGRLPLIVVLLIYAALALRLNNTAFIDEARNISAGRDYLLHWFGDGPKVDHSAYFSGAAIVYPVIAALLNSVGGLAVVRLFSLLCMVVTVAFLQSAVAQVSSSRRVGLLAAAAFAFTAPVVYLGALGTVDALCLMLLAAALWAGVRDSHRSAVGAGCLLALAVVVKYTAFVFVPVLVVVIMIAADGLRPCPGAARHAGHLRPGSAAARVDAVAAGGALQRAWSRVTIVPVVAVGLLGGFALVAWDSLRKGVVFATISGSEPLSDQLPMTLLGWAVLNVSPLAVLAIAGSIAMVRVTRSGRWATAAICLLAAAAALPAAQMWHGEGFSFDQHNAYSAFFLAPLAGWALERLSRGLFRLVPVALILLVTLVPAASRSMTLFDTWADATPALTVINEDPRPGLYLSVAPDTLEYYTYGQEPRMRWEATARLYASGPDAIREAVERRTYQAVILRSMSTAGPDQDELLRWLKVSPDYEAHELVQAAEATNDHWLIYRLVNTGY